MSTCKDRSRYTLLPPTYVVRGKVMFWHASVHPSICLSTGGGYPYPIMLCNISQNAIRQRGGTRTPPGGTRVSYPPWGWYPDPPPGVPGPPWGGYPGQVPPRGVPGSGTPRGGTRVRYTPLGGVPGSGTPPGGVPGSGTPPGGTRVRYPPGGVPG